MDVSRRLAELRSGSRRRRRDIWECPQLVRLTGTETWALVVSRWHRRPDGGHELGDTQALLLEIEDAAPADAAPHGAPTTVPTPRIVGTSAVDDGPSFYAPQVLAEPDRALMIGWARERRAQELSDAAGWSGLLTWPRVLTLQDGALVSRPAPECEGWREGPAHRADDDVVVLPDAVTSSRAPRLDGEPGSRDAADAHESADGVGDGIGHGIGDGRDGLQRARLPDRDRPVDHRGLPGGRAGAHGAGGTRAGAAVAADPPGCRRHLVGAAPVESRLIS
ncbi:hypothetical protein [Nesterenkonia sp. PF2B19]|uniref:hypothetical protein n=1 Tax=Nesterenkonia sp. PF2B19 TaxID=1881858 RepID=UPI0023511A5D|nr:hypothetical protein [Nesterenkonia sp. PF2B19]